MKKIKISYVFNGILVFAAIIVLITIVLRFWGVSNLSLSALTLIQGMFLAESKLDIGDSELLKVLVFQVEFLLATPYIMAIPVIVFALLKQRWSYIVTAVLGGLETLLLLIDGLILIPNRCSGTVESLTSTIEDSVMQIPYIGDIVIGSVEDAIGIDLSEQISPFFVDGLGPGFWICVIVFVFILLISVCGYVTYDLTEASDTVQVFGEPGIVCLCGDMAGLRIPMEAGDEIMVGSDVRYCNLIVAKEHVRKNHCLIRYDGGNYILSLNPTGTTFVNEEQPLVYGEQKITVARGSRLEIGALQNVLILE